MATASGRCSLNFSRKDASFQATVGSKPHSRAALATKSASAGSSSISSSCGCFIGLDTPADTDT